MIPATHRIITFTGNPLAETTFDLAAPLNTGKTQRAQAASFQMGGKGINVSKMLLRLGCPTTALTFLGGRSGEQCRDWLQAQGIQFCSIPTNAPTRTGLVLRNNNSEETTVLGPDTPADAQAWLKAAESLEHLRSTLGHETLRTALAFCGSCPGWSSPEASPFREAIDRWIDAGLPTFVDTYGPPLAWFSKRPVDLIKINADELRNLRSASTESIAEALHSAKSNHPVKAWIISDGAGPVWYADGMDDPRSERPPAITEISPTGSGDVLLACLSHAKLVLGLNWRDSLRFALPFASANAAHAGIAEFEMPIA